MTHFDLRGHWIQRELCGTILYPRFVDYCAGCGYTAMSATMDGADAAIADHVDWIEFASAQHE